MKILLSPSKTQDFTHNFDINTSEPVYIDHAKKLNKRLMALSKKQLGITFNIKGDLLNQTHSNLRNFDEAISKPALATYTGLVYKNIDITVFGPKEFDYLDEHLRILSAYYGVLKPFDLIKPYRLDMKTSIGKRNLYKYWHKEMLDYFKDDPLIIDLASTEFSKMIDLPKVTIGFRDYKDGHYKNLATYAKMARGMLLQHLVLNNVTTLDQFKTIQFNGYSINEALSSDSQLIFTRPAIS